MLVKVCGLNSVENIAELPLGLINWLGFIFYEKSPRKVTFQPDDTFFQLTKKHNRVGVFVNTPLTKIYAAIERYGLNMAQLHGQEPVDHCADLKHNGVQVVKVISVNEETDFYSFRKYESVVDYFLLDTKSMMHGGTGTKFNWMVLKSYRLETPFILSGGIGPDDVEIINEIDVDKFVGIDINSRFEVQPGIKDAKQVQSFLESLKNTKYVTN